MNVGAALACARNGLGLTLEDVAHRTKVGVETLAAIERNELDKLPILQVRAFVAAYAAAVGLDPDELGEKCFSLGDFDSELPDGPDACPEASVNQRPPADPVAAISRPAASLHSRATTPAFPDLPLPASEPPSSFMAIGTELVPPTSMATRIPVDAFNGADLDLRLKNEDAPLAKALSTVTARAADRPIAAARGARHSRVSPGMFVLLPLIAAVVGFLFVRSLDRSWPSNVLVNLGKQQHDRVPAVPSDTAAEVQLDQAAQARRPDVVATGARSTTDSVSLAASRMAASAADGEKSRVPVDKRREDLTGSWRLTNRVQSSSYQAFEGLTLDYHLRLKQDGHLVTGDGEKRMENGRAITGTARTPISFEGTVDGRRLALRFREQGARRASVGMIVMEVADDGSLRGSFSSDAANSRGTSQAARLDSRSE
jgi:transcriptional regulator with XRE-family HTH domain